jgi:hypothetical protein
MIKLLIILSILAQLPAMEIPDGKKNSNGYVYRWVSSVGKPDFPDCAPVSQNLWVCVFKPVPKQMAKVQKLEVVAVSEGEFAKTGYWEAARSYVEKDIEGKTVVKERSIKSGQFMGNQCP